MKKTLALFLAMMAVFAFGVCAVTLDTAENAAEVAAEETAVLAAAELKPGLNVYTGTTNPYTFDGAEAVVDTEKFDFTASVETFATSANAENKAMFIDKTYEHFGLKEFPVIELERPVMLKFSVLQYGGQVRYCAISDVVAGKEKADLATTLAVGNFSYTAKASTQTGTKVANQGASAFVPSYSADYQGKPFENIYFYGYSGTMNAYVDDLAVIPYYKITYDVNGGAGAEIASTYFYVEEGAAYTALADGSALTKDGKNFIGWALTADATALDVINQLYVTPGSDITLYAVYDKAELKPGVNIFTGNANALTFDKAEDLSKLVVKGATIATYAKGEDADNKALKFTASTQNFSIKHFPEAELERPFYVGISYVYSGQIRFMANGTYDSALHNKKDAVVILASSTTAWASKTYSISPVMSDSQGVGGQKFFDAAKNTVFPNLYIYMFSNISASKPTYVDDVTIAPYYKITYDANGGTGSAQAPEYFYVAQGKTYTLKNTSNNLEKNGESFLGWALTPNATSDDIITTVTPTLGEDMTLYAVYGKPITVTLVKDGAEHSKYTTVAGKEITVNNSYFADAENYYVNWQTEDGKAVIAHKYTFENSATLTAVKYARKMTVGENAFSNGDFEEDYVEVRATAGNLFIVEDDAEHGNVLKYQRINSGYGSIQRGVIWETGRMYRLEYDVKTLSTGTTSSWNTIYGGKDHAHNGPQTVAGEWVHESHDFQHTATDAAQISDVITFYMNPIPAGVENVIYYDNLKLIPYHKVTFNANGAEGTAPSIDWTLAKTYEITAGAGEMVKDGFYLAGWATSADGEAVASVDTVVGEDIELFAVWAPVADENAPESNEESFSMRAGDKAGMRFYASVTAAQKNEATEYGFVAARADILNAIGVNAAELNLGLTYNGAGEGKLFVKGAAYIKDGDKVTLDKYLEETDDGSIIYAAVCTGLDVTNKTQVTTQFVLRPYINIGGVYAYGKPVVKSLYEVAASIDTTELPEDVVTYINTIIATAEAE